MTTTDLLAELFRDVLACQDCGKEHQERDVSEGRPVKRVSWADPDDGHTYRHRLVSTEWIRQWRDQHCPELAPATQVGGRMSTNIAELLDEADEWLDRDVIAGERVDRIQSRLLRAQRLILQAWSAWLRQQIETTTGERT